MKGKSPATIKDIAIVLGISTSTVSRALQDHPAISKKTKEKVWKEAKRINYVPNTLARSLRQKRSKTIGVVIPEVVHFFFSTVISGIEDVAYEKGYSVILTQSNEEYEREKMNISTLLNHRVDGFLIDVARDSKDLSHIEMIQKRGTPVVFFDRLVSGLTGDQVVVNDFKGAYLATDHLINLGYTRIAHLAGPPGLSITEDRLEGYKKALMDKKLGIDENMIVHGVGVDIDVTRKIAFELLSRRHRPQAIFAVNDPAAVGTLAAAQDLGIKVPDELAIIGFSNWQFTEFTNPSLSTVDQPGYDIGHQAALLLIEEIERDEEEGPKAPDRTVVLEASLILRRSTPKPESMII